MLTQYSDKVWGAERPFVWFGLDVNGRGAVVKLSDGSLWVHSPVSLDPELKKAVDALGNVKHIVTPNFEHNKFAGEVSAHSGSCMATTLCDATAKSCGMLNLEGCMMLLCNLHSMHFYHFNSTCLVCSVKSCAHTWCVLHCDPFGLGVAMKPHLSCAKLSCQRQVAGAHKAKLTPSTAVGNACNQSHHIHAAR